MFSQRVALSSSRQRVGSARECASERTDVRSGIAGSKNLHPRGSKVAACVCRAQWRDLAGVPISESWGESSRDVGVGPPAPGLRRDRLALALMWQDAVGKRLRSRRSTASSGRRRKKPESGSSRTIYRGERRARPSGLGYEPLPAVAKSRQSGQCRTGTHCGRRLVSSRNGRSDARCCTNPFFDGGPM
jgi:hypothetical protein